MTLIDKEALVAEIERRKQVSFGWMETAPNDAIEAEFELCDDILSFIDTLEVKEVDLEKEINHQIEKYYDECEDKLTNMSDDDTDISFLTLNQFAKHMWELGFKAAQKGE